MITNSLPIAAATTPRPRWPRPARTAPSCCRSWRAPQMRTTRTATPPVWTTKTTRRWRTTCWATAARRTWGRRSPSWPPPRGTGARRGAGASWATWPCWSSRPRTAWPRWTRRTRRTTGSGPVLLMSRTRPPSCRERSLLPTKSEFFSFFSRDGSMCSRRTFCVSSVLRAWRWDTRLWIGCLKGW